MDKYCHTKTMGSKKQEAAMVQATAEATADLIRVFDGISRCSIVGASSVVVFSSKI